MRAGRTETDEESSTSEEMGYQGTRAHTATKAFQHRCRCGKLSACKLIASLDAVADPELADRAKVPDALHAFMCTHCEEEQVAAVAFTFHNASEGVFVLVLPEGIRHRELEERAALLGALAKEECFIPDYVVNHAVVYGALGLAEFLADHQGKDAQTLLAEDPLSEDIGRREAQLVDRESELVSRRTELDSRSAQLTEQELGLQDRSAALDRRSDELSDMAAALKEVKEQLRAGSEGELPAALRDDQTEALSLEDILTSAPNPESEEEIPSVTVASGTSVKKAPTAPKIAAPLAPLVEIGEQESARPAMDAGEVHPREQEWREGGGKQLKLLRGNEVCLLVSLQASELEELLASDIRALLQLHRMPSYPLVSLTLARATTLAGQEGKPFSFHFDVALAEDRALLARLGEDFRFRLEIFDSEHKAVRERRLAAPLAANIDYVMALAADAQKELSPRERDFAEATKSFEGTGYDRLGRGHRLARDFRDSLLDTIEKPTDLLGAIAQCERFSAPVGEEYLVAIRSYPYERWHYRRLQVIKRAIALGLWMGSDLARVAVSEELVRSRRELVATCQANFGTLTSADEPGLSASSIEANWAVLTAEADSLVAQSKSPGATGVKSRRAPSPVEIGPVGTGPEEHQLLLQLERPEVRKQAVIALCHRKSLQPEKSFTAVDSIFRALAELEPHEAAEAFAAVAELGNQAAESLLVLLRCPSAHLRHGAALVLCELANDEGIDSICESLVRSEGTLWHEYAIALGRVGASAVMPLVARIAQAGEQGEQRAVWALAYVAHNGASKPIETLSLGRDKTVSRVASASLELAERLGNGHEDGERTVTEQAFTEAFLRAIAGESVGYASAELSGPAMILDEADLIIEVT